MQSVPDDSGFFLFGPIFLSQGVDGRKGRVLEEINAFLFGFGGFFVDLLFVLDGFVDFNVILSPSGIIVDIDF